MRAALLLLVALTAYGQIPEGSAGAAGNSSPNRTAIWSGSSTTGDITHSFSAEAAAAAVITCYDPAGVLLTGWTLSYPDSITLRITFGSAQAAGTVCSANATGTGLQGTAGPAGATGPAGLSVLNGAGVPDNGVGQNGEFYLRTSDACLYGPKAAGAWPGTCVSLTNVLAGLGNVIVDGNKVASDSAIDVVRREAADPPIGTCTPGREVAYASTLQRLYWCKSDGVWEQLGGGGSSTATESIWLPAGQRTATSSSVYQWIINSGATATTFTYNAEALAQTAFSFADAASNVIQTWFLWPESWNDGTFDVRLFHRGTTATAGNIRWQYDVACVGNGTDLDNAFTFGASPGLITVANGGDGVLGVDTLSAMAVPSSCPGSGLALFKLTRLGSDGADTSSAAHHFLGLEIKYTRTIP